MTAGLSRVGFVGLGMMGERMAVNLAKSGLKLNVSDLNPAAVARLVDGHHAKAYKDFAQLAHDSDVVITMLPSSPNVRDVYAGLIPGLRPGSLCIDSSTIDPATAQATAQAVAARKAKMLDAPVSGGVTGAQAGTLTFMVGGDEADLERARPFLSKMGKNIVHCGPSGTGQAAKICNNLLLGISMIGTAEAFNLGVRLGIDPKKLASIVNTSSGRCWSSDSYQLCFTLLRFALSFEF